MATLFLIL